MRYKLLGKSGLRVSELCLGTMTFGETWGWGASKEESQKQFDLFAEAGGNFIDTSVNYTDGTAETFLGDFIQADREHFVVATKYSLTKPESIKPNSGGNSFKNMRQSVERSLKRLQTDYVDILYLHIWDYMTPIEEVLYGMDTLVKSGKVLYVAISDSPAWVVSMANMLAELRGYPRFLGLQLPYSLARRDIERDLLPMAKHWEMTVLPWGMIGGGVLTGKYTHDVKDDEPTRMNKEELRVRDQTRAIIDELRKVSEETGRSTAQIAIQWVRQQEHRANMIPILGARNVDQLKNNLAVLEWSLNEDQLKRLHEVSKLDLGFPHYFANGNQYLFGKTYDMIDNTHMGGNPIPN